jgi:RES domain-containing protein
MLLHRIALAANSSSAAAAFSGLGGLYGKGRWSTQGRLIVYASQHKSLAMAESLVHLQRSNCIAAFNHYTIEVPDALILPLLPPPANWKRDLAATQALGDAFLARNAYVGQLVPSAVVDGEHNCLLNPAHPKFDLRWVVSGPTPFDFDGRLTKP